MGFKILTIQFTKSFPDYGLAFLKPFRVHRQIRLDKGIVVGSIVGEVARLLGAHTHTGFF